MFLTTKSFSHDENNGHGCNELVPILDTKYFESIKEQIEWFAATDSNVAKAPCKRTSPLRLNEAKAFISRREIETAPFFNIPFLKKEVNGVKFKGESSELLAAFEKLTTAKDIFGIFENKKEQVDFQARFAINPACEKVRCAVEKIWGVELGNKILYTLLKHGFNASEFASKSSDRFTLDELDDVLIGLEDLPNFFKPLGHRSGQRLTHFSRGYTLAANGPGVLANAVIMLYDGWSKQKTLARQYTLFHELSHNISNHQGDLDNSPEWLKLSGWIKKGDEWSKNPSACFMSNYGDTNPAEDWAESVSAFRYNAVEFKKKCPAKFNYIKQAAFRGIEYTSNQTCASVH